MWYSAAPIMLRREEICYTLRYVMYPTVLLAPKIMPSAIPKSIMPRTKLIRDNRILTMLRMLRKWSEKGFESPRAPTVVVYLFALHSEYCTAIFVSWASQEVWTGILMYYWFVFSYLCALSMNSFRVLQCVSHILRAIRKINGWSAKIPSGSENIES